MIFFLKRICFIVLFLPSIFFAQAPFVDGYVVLNNGDTVRGKIKDRKFTNDPPQCDKINFMDSAERKTYYTAYEVKQYFRQGKYYYTLNVGFENKPKFCEMFFSGDVVLFGFVNDTQSFIANDMGERIKEKVAKKDENSEIEYFLQYKNKPKSLMKVKRKTFIETTTFFFQDNPVLVQKIENKEYKYVDLETVVKLYNESKKQSK